VVSTPLASPAAASADSARVALAEEGVAEADERAPAHGGAADVAVAAEVAVGQHHRRAGAAGDDEGAPQPAQGEAAASDRLGLGHLVDRDPRPGFREGARTPAGHREAGDRVRLDAESGQGERQDGRVGRARTDERDVGDRVGLGVPAIEPGHGVGGGEAEVEADAQRPQGAGAHRPPRRRWAKR
jgi:hypothetical protein